MSPNDLIGRRVKVITWEHLNRIAYYLRRTREHGESLEGTVTHIEACGDSADEGGVGVQINGLAKEYVFGPSQLEALSLAGASHPCHNRPRNSHWPESPVSCSAQTWVEPNKGT